MGKRGFKKAGDLNRATAQIRPDDFKILMSHDPSHWEAEVLPHPMPFEMTLAATHGMQFGIEIPGWFKWSPVQWRYKQWVGLYKSRSMVACESWIWLSGIPWTCRDVARDHLART